MSGTMAERFADIRLEKKLNKKQFADAIEIVSTTVGDIESGKREPSKDVLIKLASKYNVNLHWMLTGEGPRYVTSQGLSNSLSGLAPSPGLIDHNGRARDQFDALPDTESEEAECESRDVVVRLNGRTATELAVIKADPEIGYVDFYCEQRAGMGPGKDVLEYQESVRLPIIRRFLQPYRPDEVRALEARGDSMSKIGIFDRDIVLYVPEEKDGDGVYVISRENKLQVKRLEFDITDKELRIISENDRYQPKILRGAEADSIVVEGKVIGWLHRHPY